MRFLVSIVFAFLATFQLSAQQFGITAKPDTNIIFIGQQINVDVSVSAKDGDFVSLPILIDSLASDVEIVKQTEWDTIANGNIYSLHKRVTITSWDSGYYPIPPIPTVINNDTFASDAFLIAVADVPVDSTNAIADIKPLLTDPLTMEDYINAYGKYVLWVWLGALIIGLIIVLIIRLRRKPEVKIEVKPDIPAHIIALGKLKTLEDEELWQNNQIKRYHVALSEIVREYVENRFKVAAMEQTTEEILHFLRLSELTDVQKQSLRRLLMLTDLVKFAKETPLASENQEILKIAYQLVEETKLIVVEPPKEES